MKVEKLPFTIIAGFIMSLLYLAAGIYLLLNSTLLNLTDFQKYGLGSILIVYGFFRLYRTIIKIKKSEAGGDEE